MNFLTRMANHRLGRVTVVLVGIALGQGLLYGPSLIGAKVLLPLDTLAQPNVYLPQVPGQPAVAETDSTLSDQIYVNEPARRFMIQEFRAGRLPVWVPDYFAGAPFVWPKFNPYNLIACASESPVAVAWTQLATALVAGLGLYFFLRRVLGVAFWPASVGAWAYPLTGFFVIWEGYWIRATVSWLPWLLLGIHACLKHSSISGTILLAGFTALTALTGQLDTTGQVLLVSGFFGVWSLSERWRTGATFLELGRMSGKLAAGWLLGLMLATPYLLPVMEYAGTGSRIIGRSSGAEERPPMGISALPQILLPDYYGRSTHGSLLITPYQPGNLQESPVGSYAGIISLFVLVPLAWCRDQRRRLSWFLVGLAVLGVGWCVDLPVLVDVLRLPALNMMSHNRLTFATSFALTVLAVMGLESLSRREPGGRCLAGAAGLACLGLAGFAGYRAVVWPEELIQTLPAMINAGKTVAGIATLAEVQKVQAWFVMHFIVAGLLALAGGVLWCLFALKQTKGQWLAVAATGLLMMDLGWFAYGRSPQCDPAWYYPNIPALEAIRHAEPGRVIGFRCLPANVAAMAGLNDIRGCDGVDPRQLVELLALAREPNFANVDYSAAMFLEPRVYIKESGQVQLSPVLDLLGVRYVIFRGEPPLDVRPRFFSPDYYVLENTNAQPRVFVPTSVEWIADDASRLARMAAADFRPGVVAFIEQPVALPSPCRGSAAIRRETPTRITVEVRMETSGLLVLTDLWDRGWQATVNGKRVEILRVNHAVRGVLLSPDSSLVEFHYQPASLRIGFWLASLSAIVLAGFAYWSFSRRVSGRNQPSATEH